MGQGGKNGLGKRGEVRIMRGKKEGMEKVGVWFGVEWGRKCWSGKGHANYAI